ncbi:substrate of the Dot/Icm system [Legionella nautarum]|uniref:Substrate of the Dot/Icm system n=1 Tax=Legionella nautarum TaxID=45070 RepID=A0A0W0WVQ2_9GAMM|nr:alpha/beta hydrolase [Legionella nautarum]KTD36393.1 substrate of the Dot/Icm system [Legionella nautarum]
MKEFPIIAQPFREQLEPYLRRRGMDRLVVKYCDQRPCFFLEADPETDTSVQVGYLLWNNQLYYRSDLSSLSAPVYLTDEEVDDLKEQIDYPSNPSSPVGISLSQSQAFVQYMGPREIDFLTIEITENQLSWQFNGDEDKVKVNDEEKIHPVLSGLYDTLKKDNELCQENRESQESRFFPQPESDYRFEMPEKTLKQTLLTPFYWLNSGLQIVLRTLIFDNIIFKYTIGLIIATIANYGNPYYRTEPGTLSDILRRIIFPGGSKKPQINQDGSLTLDPVLSKQFHALKLVESHRNRETDDIEYQIDDETIKFKEFYIEMPDGSQVAGIEASNRLAEAHSDNEQIPYVIFFNGNSGCYQDEIPFDAYYLEACAKKGIPVHMIRFNYPGVLNSTGFPSTIDDLVLSGVAQVQRLSTQGIKYENIQLYGLSLGGAIASHVASFFHALEKTLGACYVSRTFSSTTNVGLSYVRKIPFAGTLLGYLLRPVLAFGLWGTQWLADTAKHLASLPDDRTWYTVAHTKLAIHSSYAEEGKEIKDDAVLVYDSSIHQSWRMKFKRFLAKHFGLFGYKQETLLEMNLAHKIVTCVEEVGEDGQQIIRLSHRHCAHADARPFGLSLDEKGDVKQFKDSTAMISPQLKLLVRSPSAQNLASIETQLSEVSIAQYDELGNQSIEFLRKHSQRTDSLTSTTYFDFFREESEREKLASNVVQFFINCVP